ncbi:hypothetical protein JRQ81_000133 [Phrynocephalus forsythii]|uniref:BTB domain-containing protein n=1 Tax=Phrynocephalus forsythii TaxID=171643 RepID=A0A9Q0Y5I9_9SAUR|nr:hypothetical protein JRQ81_000133 [Phrynocephalus forsythii]
MNTKAPNPKILYRNSRLLRMVFLQLHRQQRADLFCDVVLQAEGETVPAHCCILSACSPFFTERLEREMPLKGHKVVLEIRGLKIGTLRKLVDFLYTSEMEVSREEAQEILAAGRQLQVSELESLQLEGGKLVKKSLGPRLNRGCLQVSSPISLPETSLVLSSPVDDGCSSLTSLMVTGKQHRVMKLSGTQVIRSDNGAEQKETKKGKPPAALSSGDKEQISKGQTVTAEPLKTKAKKHPSGMVRSIVDKSESNALDIKETSTVQRLPTVNLMASKTIKLHRSKVPSAPSPVLSSPKGHSTMMSGKLPRPSRRLWRKKSPGKDKAKDAEEGGHLPGFWSPPLLPKPNKGRKRNFSEPAPRSDFPPVAGQIGRVKLRRVINGSCWEVVQESPAPQPAGAANTVRPLKDEVSQPQPTCPVSVVDVQPSASSARLLPAKQERACCSEKSLIKPAETKMVLDEEDSAAGTPYDLHMLVTDHVAEGDQYGSLASAGELEHLLDFLLPDAAATGESQGTAVPEGTAVLEGMHMACPEQGGNKSPLASTGAEEKYGSPTKVPVSPLLVETEKNPLREAPDLEDKRLLSSSGGPFPDPVLCSSPLVTNESISDSASLNDWTVPEHPLSVLENGAARSADPLPVTLTCDEEDQGLLSDECGFLATEAQPHGQAVLRSPVQHDRDYKLPCVLTILEEEDLDVGGVEELFISSKCVRPDPSPEIELLHREVYSKCSDPCFHEVVPNTSFPHTQSLQCMENMLRSRWQKEQHKC